MKKIFLSVIGFAMVCRFSAQAQTTPDNTRKQPFSLYSKSAGADSTGYKSRALRLDEVNFVTSYYSQDGKHSAITGGIGTEQVTDLSNGLDLKLVWDGRTNTNTLSVGLGIDHHTSASSAYVTTTGKGKKDGSRIYPSLDWTTANPRSGTSFGIGAYYSGEYNYQSLGADVHFAQKTNDQNGEFGLKLQAYRDHVTLIYPSEFIAAVSTPAPVGSTYITTASGNRVLVTAGSNGKTTVAALPTSPRNTYTASLSYAQDINSRLRIMLLADVVKQDGMLSLPFHRVYFSSGKDTLEVLPSSRFKIPIGVRLNYFLGDNVILRSYYRYYHDDWGTNAHTASLELAYKVSPFFSVSPFYRYYTQTAAKYFAPYEAHPATDKYFTSNFEYASFGASFFGAGFRISPPRGVLGWHSFHELELRYGHYTQTTELVSDVVSVSIGFK